MSFWGVIHIIGTLDLANVLSLDQCLKTTLEQNFGPWHWWIGVRGVVIEDENGDGECASAFAWEETNIKWKQEAHHCLCAEQAKDMKFTMHLSSTTQRQGESGGAHMKLLYIPISYLVVVKLIIMFWDLVHNENS